MGCSILAEKGGVKGAAKYTIGQRTTTLKFIYTENSNKYHRDISRLLRLSDPFITAGSLMLIAKGLEIQTPETIPVMACTGGLILALAAQGFGLYRSSLEGSLWRRATRATMAWATVITTLLTWLFFQKSGEQYSRMMMLLWFTSIELWLTGSQLTCELTARKRWYKQKQTIRSGFIGSMEKLEELRARWQNSGHGWIQLVPVLIWERLGNNIAIESLALEEKLLNNGVDQLILEEPEDPEILDRLLQVLTNLTSPIILLPRWLEKARCYPRHCTIGEVAALQLWGEEASEMELGLKRTCDYVVSTIALVLLTPILITIGILIRIDSEGPVLFRQRRYGMNGKAFNCLKFRTMTVLENDSKVDQATRNDSRVTALGRILRRWSLDELPQLINVWRGEMSMVGPRPHAEAHNEFYRNKVRGYMRRHSHKPGITGLAQVLGLRGATETIAAMDARVEADLHYINNWNLILDLEILLLTLIRFHSPNAY